MSEVLFMQLIGKLDVVVLTVALLHKMLFFIIRSTPPSRPNKVGLKMSVRPSVRPSTKSFFDFNDIWYAGRGRRVMHDGMQYDPI